MECVADIKPERTCKSLRPSRLPSKRQVKYRKAAAGCNGQLTEKVERGHTHSSLLFLRLQLVSFSPSPSAKFQKYIGGRSFLWHGFAFTIARGENRILETFSPRRWRRSKRGQNKVTFRFPVRIWPDKGKQNISKMADNKTAIKKEDEILKQTNANRIDATRFSLDLMLGRS